MLVEKVTIHPKSRFGTTLDAQEILSKCMIFEMRMIPRKSSKFLNCTHFKKTVKLPKMVDALVLASYEFFFCSQKLMRKL